MEGVADHSFDLVLSRRALTAPEATARRTLRIFAVSPTFSAKKWVWVANPTYRVVESRR